MANLGALKLSQRDLPSLSSAASALPATKQEVSTPGLRSRSEEVSAH